jgi:hypothetical protein
MPSDSVGCGPIRALVPSVARGPATTATTVARTATEYSGGFAIGGSSDRPGGNVGYPDLGSRLPEQIDG